MDEKNNNFWQKILESIKLKVNEQTYEAWFQPIEIYAVDELSSILYLKVKESSKSNLPEDFTINLLKKRYIPLIESSAEEALSKTYKIILRTKKEYDENPINIKRDLQIKSSNLQSELSRQRIMNPKYRFDNFIVGDSNMLAHAAALAVAESPSNAFNPLFIYGGSGLGKTHLMHAIGIYLTENNSNLNILYVSSEMFTNEFIESLKDNKKNSFMKKYREVDVLMIDDIQFLEGKERTQEEFFHTFTTLYNENKQIVISSDRSPQKLENLHERLKSRFGSNMVAELQPANLETRIAILKKYAELQNIQIDEDMDEVIQIIAEKITDNIRELEGAMGRIISFSSILNEKIDYNFAKRILKDIMQNGGKSVTPEKIKTVVSRHFNIKVSDLESKGRKDSIAHPRQIAMYLCRELTDYSHEKIGNLFGGRHYSTVIHACDKIKGEIEISSPMKQVIEDIKKEISN